MAIVDLAPYLAELPKTQGMAYLGKAFNMNSMVLFVQCAIIVRMLLALLLGFIVGLAHGWRYQDNVGYKTYGAVCVGSAAFAAINTYLYLLTNSAAPLFNYGGIIQGIGFLCAAVIFKDGNIIRGLSTGATIWTTAAIGAACGTGLPGVGIGIALVVLLFHILPRRIMAFTSEE